MCRADVGGLLEDSDTTKEQSNPEFAFNQLEGRKKFADDERYKRSKRAGGR